MTIPRPGCFSPSGRPPQSSLSPNSLPVLRLMKCKRSQARHRTASKTSPLSSPPSSSTWHWTLNAVSGHRKMKLAMPKHWDGRKRLDDLDQLWPIYLAQPGVRCTTNRSRALTEAATFSLSDDWQAQCRAQRVLEREPSCLIRQHPEVAVVLNKTLHGFSDAPDGARDH